MHALGISTTRALSLVTTGDRVPRDLLYDGHIKMEPGALLCRLAPSFMRFGTFQLPAARGGAQAGLVEQLADYMIRHHFPRLQGPPSPCAAMLQEVCRANGRLVALWQCVGFVHGVLNTDNCAVLSFTLDYGPFAFMEACDLSFTANLDDEDKRYCYQVQPAACKHNVGLLAQALLAGGLVDRAAVELAMEVWQQAFSSAYKQTMAAKLGLRRPNSALHKQLLALMEADRADFTNTFRELARIPAHPQPHEAGNGTDSNASSKSNHTGPHQQTTAVSTHIAAAQPDGHGERLSTAAAAAQQLPPALAAVLPCQVLQCHSRVQAWLQWVRAWRAAVQNEGLNDTSRWAVQRAVSAKFVPRQHLMQAAIEGAEHGDTSELHALQAVLSKPYDEQPDVPMKYSTPLATDAVQPGVHLLTGSS